MNNQTDLEIFELLDQYEHRFANAMSKLPSYKPWLEEDRKAIKEKFKSILGIQDSWVPEIKTETLKTEKYDKFEINYISFESWENVQGTAFLYRPLVNSPAPLPLVFLWCGHGEGGKLCPMYQTMARHLARQGTAVLVADNIGQGERAAMGHRDCAPVFACGLSVRGLIIMECLAWIKWAVDSKGFDKNRIGSVGNSGGGAITIALAALNTDLQLISSSGAPCTFEYVAKKEKKFCHCNLLPGVVGKVEMWHLMGCFAPKPMLIFQGANDHLCPIDIFYSTARKANSVYSMLDSGANLKYEIVNGQHPWNKQSCVLLGKYITEQFKLPGCDFFENEDLLDATDTCLDNWPEHKLTTNAIAKMLTGKNPAENVKIHEIFPPEKFDVTKNVPLRRTDALTVMSQFECFIKND